MIDYQRIAEDIRAAVACNDQETRELLAESAADFAVAAEEVNARLRQCADLLRQGLRSEALQLCEREPNLLDVVGTLDVPEWDAWLAKLKQFDIATPPALKIDIASDLNEAYAIEQPLAESLRIHRLQALGRVPLALRIGTIRKLAQLDAENPVWQQDQRSYEKARLQEIPAAAELAVKQRDYDAIQSLATELAAPGWLEPVPPSIRNGIKQAEIKLRRKRGLRELERLEPLLTQAFGEYDEEQGLELRESWDRFAAEAELSSQHELCERAQPALDWLDRISQQRQAEHASRDAQLALDQALNENTGAAALERLHHAAVRWQPLPDSLEKRYQTRLAALRLSADRRRRAIIIAASLLVLCAAGLAAMGIHGRNVRAEVERHAATFSRLLDVDHLAEAEKYLGELQINAPHVATSATMSGLALDFEQLRSSEQQRATQFESALQSAIAAGVESPDKRSLDEATELARTDAEKLALIEFEGQVRSAQRRMQQERDEKFSARLAEISDRLKAAEGGKKPSVELLASLEPIRGELQALLGNSGTVSAPLVRSGEALQRRIGQLQTESLRRQRELGTLPKITAAVGDLDRYQAELERYVKDFADTKRADDFRRVIAETLPLHMAMQEWIEFAATWTEAQAGELRPAKAAELASKLQEMQSKHAQLPWVRGLDQRVAYLQAIQTQGEIGPITDLKRLLADRLISNMWMIQDGEDRYYLTQPMRPIENQPDPFTVEYVVAFDGSKKKKAFRKRQFEPEGHTWYGVAPQSAVAARAMESLAQLGQHPWESVFLSICSEIQQQERIEPIVQLILLEQVLNVGAKGSPLLAESCERAMNLLKTSPVDLTTVWLNPESPEVKPQRSLAADLMLRLPPFEEMQGKIDEQREQLRRLPLTKVQYVGWLAQTDDGWKCLPENNAKVTGDLYVLTQRVQDGPAQMLRVGAVSPSGEIALSSGQGLTEGQLVFAAHSNSGASR